MSDKVWQWAAQQRRTTDMFAFVETHVNAADTKSWDIKARSQGLRLFPNAARCAARQRQVAEGREARANEG
eukprot:9481181-Pyramimonas_sp.AAC.1